MGIQTDDDYFYYFNNVRLRLACLAIAAHVRSRLSILAVPLFPPKLALALPRFAALTILTVLTALAARAIPAIPAILTMLAVLSLLSRYALASYAVPSLCSPCAPCVAATRGSPAHAGSRGVSDVMLRLLEHGRSHATDGGACRHLAPRVRKPPQRRRRDGWLCGADHAAHVDPHDARHCKL
jgi:hypothetical protein